MQTATSLRNEIARVERMIREGNAIGLLNWDEDAELKADLKALKGDLADLEDDETVVSEQKEAA